MVKAARMRMEQTKEEKNKEFVLKAIDTLFNKKDYASAERFWSPQYVQHSAHVPAGREGLFGLVKSVPSTLRYENQLIAASGDYVMLHGRYSGRGPGVPNWVVVDIVRIEDGVIVEHWDVIEDEVSEKQSKGGYPMFGDRFPSAA
jgi:predicted SnoaL-like aldol condensation-catalyzing enzyme